MYARVIKLLFVVGIVVAVWMLAGGRREGQLAVSQPQCPPTSPGGFCVLATHEYGVNIVAFSPDGKLLASGSNDNKIKIFEVRSGKELRSLEAHNDNVESLAFSPDGTLLASGSDDAKVILYFIGDLK